MDPAEKIRAFLALPLAEAFETSVRPAIEQLKAQYPEVKWVEPSQIHVTLHFFGGIKPKDIAKISDCVIPVTQKTKPLHLSLYGMGGFPNLERPQVIWAGMVGPISPTQGKLGMAEALIRLHASLEEQFKTRGFECEGRVFKPHLTLGRIREGKRISFKEIELAPTGVKQVSEIILFKSVLSSAGPKYEKIQTFPLSLS